MTAAHSNYVGDLGIYRPFQQKVSGFDLSAVRAAAVARKSDEDDGLALEQAGKAYFTISRSEPDLAELIERHAVVTWLDPEVRAELGMVDFTLADVGPWRFEDGSPRGREVIAHGFAYKSVFCLVVPNSGFKHVLDEQKARYNPYSELVIQLLKVITEAAGPDGQGSFRLRLANDRRRKGRLAIALGRMDDFRKRLGFEVWYGAQHYPSDTWASLVETLTNETNEIDRTSAVAGMLTGRLSAIHSGNLPSAEANLPPTLRHRTDPDAPGVDKRIRTEQGHLVTFHAWEVQPALEEYLTAFARGASDTELAIILRTHQVPTPSQSKERKRNGSPKISAQRDTTFDQLPFTEAVRRARRWMLFSDYRLRPVPAGGDEKVELANVLAVRKLQLVSDGRSVFKWKNSTPTIDAYDAKDRIVAVKRSHRLDDGRLEEDLVAGFPDKHVVTTTERWVDATGAPVGDDGADSKKVTIVVATEDVVTDEDGKPVQWTGWGIDPAVIWLCAERLWKRTAERVSDTHTNGRIVNDRLLGSPRWWETHPVGDRGREWQLWRRGAKQRGTEQIYRHRWLIWRDESDSWTAIKDGLSNRRRSDPDRDFSRHHVATFNERHMVRSVATAMKEAVRDHLRGEVPLQAPASAEREAKAARRRGALQSEIDALSSRIAAAEHKIEEYDLVAARAERRGDQGKARQYDEKSLAAAEEAEALRAEKAEKEAHLDRVEEDAETDDYGAEAFQTVAELIALIDKSAAGDWDRGRGPGDLPATVARRVAQMFTDWDVSPPTIGVDGISNCAWACTWVLTMADGTTRTLPLSGTWTNTKNGLGAKNSTDQEIVRRILVEGETFEDVERDLVVDTSKQALWANRVRPLLKEWGVPTSLRAPLYDSWSQVTKQIVAVRLGGADRPRDGRWTQPLEDHVTATYDGSLRRRWNESAVPTDTNDLHAVMEMVAQHPGEGVTLLDLAAVADRYEQVARFMITPPATKKQTQPQMLEWRDTGVVGLIPCPHPDCPVPTSFADFLLYLPETVPALDGSIGGVLCRHCRRLPRRDMARVRFTPDYFDLSRLTGAGYREKGVTIAEGITRQLDRIETVPVPAATHGTVARVARDFGLSRYEARQLVRGLPATVRKTAPAGASHRLYDLREVERRSAALDAAAGGSAA